MRARASRLCMKPTFAGYPEQREIRENVHYESTKVQGLAPGTSVREISTVHYAASAVMIVVCSPTRLQVLPFHLVLPSGVPIWCSPVGASTWYHSSSALSHRSPDRTPLSKPCQPINTFVKIDGRISLEAGKLRARPAPLLH